MTLLQRRLSRRRFLNQWLSGTLLALSGSFFGAVAAYEAYARYSISRLGRLTSGTSAALYPAAAATSLPTPLSQTLQAAAVLRPPKDGAEPPLFVAARPPGPPVSTTKPLWIIIPAIDLRSECVELSTQVVDGQLVWKTADHAVGHHVGTAMPGDTGNCVMSGHISSPVSKQGNVFHRLPELADKLGSDVEIIMEGGRHVHYRVVGTQVVTPDAVWVMDPTPTPVLTMLTCIPDGVYTHRLVVSGTLDA